MGKLRQVTGVLENPDGFLWVIQLTQGHAVSVGIEEFEGKVVRVIKDDKKLTIELVEEVPAVMPKQQLCGVMV